MVITAVPLPPVTVVGLMVHVLVCRDDTTLQVSATSELKLPIAATVRLSVVVPPLDREIVEL